MDLKSIEAGGLNWLAGELEANEGAIETALGPVEIIAVNDGIKLADEAFAKLPFGTGAIVDAAFANYAKQLPGYATKYVGVGLSLVVTFLRDSAAHVLAA